jgi:surface-anchored protein
MKTLGAVALALSCVGVWAQPVALTNEHCDIRVVFNAEGTNKLEFQIRDSDRGFNYSPDEVVLTATEASRLTLPGDFPPLGSAGDPLWVLPATQDPEVLYLGFSGDGIPSGVFDGPVEIRLLSVSGSGDFFVWQTGGTGALEFQMNSADGLDEVDAVPLHPGGHSHHNWGFTSNGVVTLTLQATARLTGASTNETSSPTDIVFHVLPIPDPPETPFSLWQQAQWPETNDPEVIGPQADADGDDVVNLFEYAFALNPHAADPDGVPTISIREDAGEQFGVLTYRRAVAATDLRFEPVVASDLGSAEWLPLTQVIETSEQGNHQLISVRDDVSLSSAEARFFQLRVGFE